MAIRVALRHQTHYQYDRRIVVGPQVVRLKPAAHTRTPISGYSLRIDPRDHFLNWQQDAYGNYLARVVVPEPVHHLTFSVDLIAELTAVNPFDFFLEPAAEEYPVTYDNEALADLKPYLEVLESGPRLLDFVASIDRTPRRTVDFLVGLNQRLAAEIKYLIRMQPGVQTSEETLQSGQGSCRDTAFLLMQILRHLGLAARFTSGYLIQLKADQKSLDGPSGPEEDFTDLHAWTEVFLPGAGWIGLDPTSGLFAGEGHIPLASTPKPHAAAPITGSHEPCETTFHVDMAVTRIHEDPRVTKPYTDSQWGKILKVGHEVDKRLALGDVRLTMGGEPTFVSIDDMQSPQWQSEALGEDKRKLSDKLIRRLRDRFAPGALLHYGQGKWYPGESLPRWSMQCYWRRDGQPIWHDQDLFAFDALNYRYQFEDAQAFARELGKRLGVDADYVSAAYEDPIYYTWKERRLPRNVNVRDNKLENAEERDRLARIFEQGITSPVGCVLPLQYRWWESRPGWYSEAWQVRSDEMFLIPGDSAMGFRLPLESLTRVDTGDDAPTDFFPQDPLEARGELPGYEQLRQNLTTRLGTPIARQRAAPALQVAGGDGRTRPQAHAGADADLHPAGAATMANPSGPHDMVRTALCVEARQGRLCVFLPPVDRLEHFLELVAAIEETAAAQGTPVVIEGYPPPADPRLQHIKVTPDPGVIEVNVHPAHTWDELTEMTTALYEDARLTRLGTEKFDLDGTHTGTGGGNHVVLGGPTAADSPFLRRPDLLKSLVGYWHNHPSLSYLFSGRFVGPTSQAPRVDEGRTDAIYELKIALEQVPDDGNCPPWLVDRIFRHLLVDGTGNTHRAEFCIDKLYSPETASGRMGLVEFRAFEMPPHAQMSLTQQLLLRALVARFWEQPYRDELVYWGTSLHDRFMLPHFLWQDFTDVIEETRRAGFAIDAQWFESHLEFRLPHIGQVTRNGVEVDLRVAIEPWYVLGEEPAGGSLARYVDSSIERLQVRVRGMTDPRHVVTCNGRALPLHPTGQEGEYVAGVRYRAWQPPSCLHPTIPIHEPLVFDLVDTWMKRSMGGCRYHVGHPGGLNPDVFPINAGEAESRRAARFTTDYTVGSVEITRVEPDPRYPLTLDLRRGSSFPFPRQS